jgi:uncharacterized protein
LSIIFADTSTFAKRYVNETGSAWVRHLTEPNSGNIVLISELTTVEMISLFARRVRDGSLSTTIETSLREAFLVNVDKDYLAVSLDMMVLKSAQRLVRQHDVRTLDAIQLACALQAVSLLGEQIVFTCADNKLLGAASAEGFEIDNPILHP